MMRGAEEGRDGARGGGRGGHVALKRHSRRRETRRFLLDWGGEWRSMNGRLGQVAEREAWSERQQTPNIEY